MAEFETASAAATGFDWARLRRRPDTEADNLFASDAADRLIIDTAASALAGSAPGDVVTIGDGYGALTLAAASAMAAGGTSAPPAAIAAPAAAAAAEGERVGASGAGRIRVHQDAILGERALTANAAELGLTDAYRSCRLDADLVRDARTVLLRLPKSLEALDEIAALVAAVANGEVTVVAGGMQKHMSVAMNEVLTRYFDRVDVGHGRQKARMLTVRVPRREPAREALAGWPRHEPHPEVAPGLIVCAHGGAFAGTRIDIGTRLLLAHLDDAVPHARTAVDLACGTGVLGVTLALRRTGLRVVASDQSAVAAASARATAEANGVADRVEVLREDAGEGIPDGSADLVLLNPPFHNGAALDLRVGRMLVAAASRMLAPGGELWTVYNSHLDYKPSLRRLVGTTRQVDRNAKFTVTASTKR